MSSTGMPIVMSSQKCGPLTGEAHVPGDKSISHRALILGALAVGETKITGLLEGEDVLDTAKAMRAFGAEVIDHGGGTWSVHGVGVGGFAEPEQVIDCGNSGTGVRLIMGAMATTPQPEVELAAAGDRCERLFAKAEAPGWTLWQPDACFRVWDSDRLPFGAGRGAKLV